MINKVTLIGHLGKDPEIRHLESGSVVGRFSLATSESYKDKTGNWVSQTEWHEVLVWRALAERAERELKKGSLVYVEGRLRTSKYQDKDGIERSSTKVEALTYRLLEKREANALSSGNTATHSPMTAAEIQAEGDMGNLDDHSSSQIDSDLPF